MAEEAGFNVEQIVSFNRIGVLPWFVSGRIIRRKTFGRLQLKVYDSLVWLWRILDRVLPLPGLSIIGILQNAQWEVVPFCFYQPSFTRFCGDVYWLRLSGAAKAQTPVLCV